MSPRPRDKKAERPHVVLDPSAAECRTPLLGSRSETKAFQAVCSADREGYRKTKVAYGSLCCRPFPHW